MNEKQVLQNRTQVAISLAKEIPSEHIIARHTTDGISRDFLLPPIKENVAAYLKQEKNRDEDILFLNPNEEALFEVHNNFVGLHVRETEVMEFCEKLQQLLNQR